MDFDNSNNEVQHYSNKDSSLMNYINVLTIDNVKKLCEHSKALLSQKDVTHICPIPIYLGDQFLVGQTVSWPNFCNDNLR